MAKNLQKRLVLSNYKLLCGDIHVTFCANHVGINYFCERRVILPVLHKTKCRQSLHSQTPDPSIPQSSYFALLCHLSDCFMNKTNKTEY